MTMVPLVWLSWCSASTSLFREWRQMRLLACEAIDRSLLRGGVDTQVQVVTLKCCELLDEVRQRGEARALDELLLQIEERALDLALGARPVRLTCRRSDPIVATQL